MTQRYMNVSDVPLSLAVFLASDNYDYNDDPNTISATTLLKPLRQIILPARIPVGEGLVDLAAMMSNRLGAAVHDAIERSWKTNHKPAMAALGYPAKVIERIRVNPTAHDLVSHNAQQQDVIPIYLENRLKKQLGKWTVTGKFDFVGEGRVQDFKTASVWSYMNQVNALKQTQQGSIYRWLDPELITQDEMDIIHIFMDWKAGMTKSDPNYPTQRYKRQIFPLLPLAETESFIRRKLEAIDQHWETDETELPLCDDVDLWRSEPVFKFYKNGDINAKRSTKNFDNRQDAVLFAAGAGAIKEVPGQVTACKYCPAFAICTQKDDLIRSGDLVMT